jgi:predicted secreted protein
LGQPETIVLGVGKEHLVELPGLGTVGYEWEIDVEDGDVVDVSERAPPRRELPPGESVEQLFAIVGRQPGRARVRFTQRRPFEADQPPRDERTLLFEIRR